MVVTRDGGEDGDLASMVLNLSHPHPFSSLSPLSIPFSSQGRPGRHGSISSVSLSSPFLWPNNTQVTSADSKYYKWLFSGFHNALLRSRLCFQRAFLWDSPLHKNGSNEEIVMAVIIKLNEPHFVEAQLFIGASIHAIWYMGVPKALVVKKTTKGNFLNPHCTMGY